MPFDTTTRLPAREQVLVQGASDVERRFMAAVYRWMTLGLGLTALVAYAIAASAPARQIVHGNPLVFLGLIFAQLALVIGLSRTAARLSSATAGGLFLLYSALTGATLSVILVRYTSASVAMAFVSTAGTFAAMSIYGTVTRRDLSSWRSFLFMGLIGVIIASLVNIFLQSSMVNFVISCMAVVVFTGLTAHDTQMLRALARAGGGVGGMAVNGALALYLDFVNLFLALLRLFGNRR